jgi:hypothetical protein
MSIKLSVSATLFSRQQAGNLFNAQTELLWLWLWHFVVWQKGTTVAEEPTATVTENAESTLLQSVGNDPHRVMWHNLLTPWNRVLLEKLTGLYLVKKSPRFIEPEGLLPLHNCPPPVSILSQPNPVHIPTYHFLKIHPNIILPPTPGSPQWSLFLKVPYQNLTHASLRPYRRYMPRSSHSSRFYHPHNIGWGVEIMKILIMKFSQFPCFLVPLRSKYSPQYRTQKQNSSRTWKHPFSGGDFRDAGWRRKREIISIKIRKMIFENYRPEPCRINLISCIKKQKNSPCRAFRYAFPALMSWRAPGLNLSRIFCNTESIYQIR